MQKFPPLLSLLLGMLWLLAGAPARAQGPAWQTILQARSESDIACLATDPAGAIYLTGSFEDTLRLGSLTLRSKGGQKNSFVAKWSPTQSRVEWVQQLTGPGRVNVGALVVQGSDVYLLGDQWGDSLVVGSTLLRHPGSTADGRGFLLKLHQAQGQVRVSWVKQVEVPDLRTEVRLHALAVRGRAVYVAGKFEGTTSVLGGAPLASPGRDFTLFVAKLTDDGPAPRLRWVQRAEGGDYALDAAALAVAGKRVYLAGGFAGAGIRFGTTVLANAGTYDGFVAKLTDAGRRAAWAWAQRLGSSRGDNITALVACGRRLYVAGTFATLPGDAPVTFGTAGQASADSRRELFVAKLLDEGRTSRFGWLKRAGGSNLDQFSTLALRGRRLYLAGNISSDTAYFDRSILTKRAAADDYSVVAQLDDHGSAAAFGWVRRLDHPSFTALGGIALSGHCVYVAGGFRGKHLGRGWFAWHAYLAYLPDAAPKATRRPPARQLGPVGSAPR